jgi:hypothetical protein
MIFDLYTNFGAQNSPPIFEAFAKGLKKFRHEVTYNTGTGDIAVIWSVLWHGRMMFNKDVFFNYRAQNKPVIVLEVGGLERYRTWKIGINGINQGSQFVQGPKDSARREKLGILLAPWRTNDGHILICSQHEKSHQWAGQPSMADWVKNIVQQIRQYSERPITLRYHPRYKFPVDIPGITIDNSKSFEEELNTAHAVVTVNSNPGIEAAIHGVPIFVDPSSWASPVGNFNFADIENPAKPDREQWLNDICWYEWTEEEMREGIPQSLLLAHLQFSKMTGS